MTAPIPLIDIYEKDLDSLIIETAGIPHPHCVIGQGYGSRDCQQKYAYMNLAWKGPWFEEVKSIENGFMDTGGILMPLTLAQYTNRQVDTRYKAVDDIGGLRPTPSQNVRLWLEEEATYRTLQIQDVEVAPSGKLSLQLGQRAFDEIDAFNAQSSLGNAYLQEYLVESGNSISSTGLVPGSAMTIGDDVDGWGMLDMGNFTIPTSIGDASNNCRVTLDIAMTLAGGTPKAEGEMYLDFGGGGFQNGYFNHYLLGDTISGIDITPYVIFGSAQDLKIYCKLRGEWIGSNPTATFTATIHAWRRITRV